MYPDDLPGFLAALGSTAPVPGGGTASAIAAAFGAALVRKVFAITAAKAEPAVLPRLKEAEADCREIEEELRALGTRDAEAYGKVSSAYKLPKDNPARPDAIQSALKEAASVPLETAMACLRVLKLSSEAAATGRKSALSDAGVGALLADAALKGALMNVRVNLPSITDADFKAKTEAEAARLDGEGKALADDVNGRLRSR